MFCQEGHASHWAPTVRTTGLEADTENSESTSEQHNICSVQHVSNAQMVLMPKQSAANAGPHCFYDLLGDY